jgi:hypothetical protein
MPFNVRVATVEVKSRTCSFQLAGQQQYDLRACLLRPHTASTYSRLRRVTSQWTAVDDGHAVEPDEKNVADPLRMEWVPSSVAYRP